MIETARLLREAADILDDWPDDIHWDYTQFGFIDLDPNDEDEHPCGTSACALGILGIRGHAGLKTKWEGGSTYKSLNFYDENGSPLGPFVAGQLHYGITQEESHWLFSAVKPFGNHLQTRPSDVAAAMRQLADKYA